MSYTIPPITQICNQRRFLAIDMERECYNTDEKVNAYIQDTEEYLNSKFCDPTEFPLYTAQSEYRYIISKLIQRHIDVATYAVCNDRICEFAIVGANLPYDWMNRQSCLRLYYGDCQNGVYKLRRVHLDDFIGNHGDTDLIDQDNGELLCHCIW